MLTGWRVSTKYWTHEKTLWLQVSFLQNVPLGILFYLSLVSNGVCEIFYQPFPAPIRLNKDNLGELKKDQEVNRLGCMSMLVWIHLNARGSKLRIAVTYSRQILFSLCVSPQAGSQFWLNYGYSLKCLEIQVLLPSLA
jgi:hypothetical protein